MLVSGAVEAHFSVESRLNITSRGPSIIMAAFLFQTPGLQPSFYMFLESVVGTAAHDVCHRHGHGHVFSQIIPRKGVTGGEKKNVIVVQTVRRCGGSFHFCPRGGRVGGEGLPFSLSDLSTCRIAARQHGHVYSCTV